MYGFRPKHVQIQGCMCTDSGPVCTDQPIQYTYPMTKPTIYKSNALIEASYKLGLTEQRILLACISQVRRDQPLTDDVFYSVSVNDIASMTGTGSNSLYDELSAAVKKLRRKDVLITMEPNGGGLKPIIMETSWVQTCVYIEREGRIELRFNKDMLQYLSELKAQFTGYALQDVIRMTSSYAIRLFEMLVQYTSVGHREISVEDFRRWLRLDDSYPLMSELRRRVVEPAVAQINEHGPMMVKWSPKKTGRSVTHLSFTFAPKKGSAVKGIERKSPSVKNTITAYELSKKARPGESTADALKRLDVALI